MFYTDKSVLLRFGEEYRQWQGIPAVAVTKNGTVFTAFYSGGKTEENGNFCFVIRENADGSWTAPIAAAYNGEESRCYDPCLWVDPLNRLWFIWAVKPEGYVYGVVCSQPDEPELVWSGRFAIGREVMMNKPIAASWGEWLFPVAVWDVKDFPSVCEEKYSFVYATADQGKSFWKKGCADVADRHFDEHMLLEKKDGTLEMYVRTCYGIGLAVSKDQGRTWEDRGDCGFGGPNSRFHISRTPEGDILLINHVDFTERNNLAVMLSEDEGKTWTKPFFIDKRSKVSYPDADYDENGNIYIVYDRERGAQYEKDTDYTGDAREILMARLTKADIKAGRIVSGSSYLRRVVSHLGRRI